MGQRPVFEGGIDLVRGHFFFIDDDDAPVRLNTGHGSSGQAQHGPAQDRVPEPQPAFEAVAGQHRAGGVKGRGKPTLVQPSRVAFRVPVAASQR